VIRKRSMALTARAMPSVAWSPGPVLSAGRADLTLSSGAQPEARPPGRTQTRRRLSGSRSHNRPALLGCIKPVDARWGARLRRQLRSAILVNQDATVRTWRGASALTAARIGLRVVQRLAEPLPRAAQNERCGPAAPLQGGVRVFADARHRGGNRTPAKHRLRAGKYAP
jgi:hypothetical protein